MRHGRLLTLLTLTAGALVAAAGPASALTLSIGGSNPLPLVPVTLPLETPVTIETSEF